MFQLGIPRINDVVSVKSSKLYKELNNFSDIFYKKIGILQNEYRWSKSPIAEWSRIYEYPFVYESILNNINKDTKKIISLGSGFTFFEFFLATKFPDINFTLFDYDNKNIELINEAKNIVGGGGNIMAISGDMTNIMLNEKYDILYSISVMEHIPNFLNVPKQIKKIMDVNSKFFLTFDVTSDKKSSVYFKKMQLLLEEFSKLLNVKDIEKIHSDFACLLKDKNVATIENIVKENIAKGPWKNYILSYIKLTLLGQRKYFIDRKMTFLCLEMLNEDI